MKITFAKIKQKLKEWSKLHYKLYPVTSGADYVTKRQLRYVCISPEENAFVTPVQYVGEPTREDVIGKLPERYIAELSNVKIIGSSNVVICDNCFVYDLLAKKNEKYNITDRGLFRVFDSPIRFGEKYVVCYHNQGNDIDKGICLVGNFSGNYYHYIYEILVKWYLIEKSDIPEDVPIIIDASARNIPQFNELLKIFIKDREIIFVEKDELRYVSLLYYPSMVNFIPPNLKKMEDLVTEDVVFDKEALVFLRKHFLAYMGNCSEETPKKFFISRKSSKWRKYNEEDVIREIVNNGFEVVYPETLTIKEQFRLFNHADEIVAASGAALSNIICCQPKTKVLVLVSGRVEAAIFSTIAKTLDIKLEYLVGSITNYNNVQSDFTIDCTKLREALSK